MSAAPESVLGLGAQLATVSRLQPMLVVGRVQALRGLTVLVRELPLPVGALVRIHREGNAAGDGGALGEVVGFDGRHAIVMMLVSAAGVRPGDEVEGLQAQRTVGVGWSMVGRVVDGLGRPIDGGAALSGTTPWPVDPDPMSPLKRARVTKPLATGVRAVDLMTTLGRGQRMGVFAGPGVGKSTLLASMIRGTDADVCVIGLIGERGREVQDFVQHHLGPVGMKRSVVVAATSDESALLRVRAAQVACAIAEHFRSLGKSVLLVMDSATRFAHAQRQIGLAVGEPPATRGYTPSVFAALARLLERAGALETNAGASGGSVTGIYSVLVEGDDMTEPVADAARGILDGHIILSRSLAQKAHYPAIDVLDSISRVADDVCDAGHSHARRQIVRLMAAYKQVEDLVQIGAYAKGSSPVADVAIRFHQPIVELLQQNLREPEQFEAAKAKLVRLAVDAGSALQQAQQSQQAGGVRRSA